MDDYVHLAKLLVNPWMRIDVTFLPAYLPEAEEVTHGQKLAAAIEAKLPLQELEPNLLSKSCC